MVDAIQFYVDNAGVINLAIGIVLTALLSKFAIKEFVKRIKVLVDHTDEMLADDKITDVETRVIVADVKNLLGEDFITMLVKAFTKK